ncbi:MAG: hypothetical protein R3E12_15935, partial [Candidatus Eisenbacteria bacterium]
MAAVWNVEASDPPECGRVGTILEMSAPGDTILLGPGRYLENLVVPHDCTLMGSGLHSTILEPCDGVGSVLRAERLDTLRVSGLGLVHGTGSFPEGLPRRVGGGMFLDRCGWVSVTDCLFEENTAEIGGGVSLVAGHGDFERCVFVNNDGEEGAGALYLGVASDVILQDCAVRWDHDGLSLYPAIQGSYSDRLSLVGCEFIGNVSWGGEQGLHLDTYDVTVRDCLFWDDGDAASATDIDLFPFDNEENDTDVLVLNTVFGSSQRLAGHPITIFSGRGEVTIAQTTTVNRDLSVGGYVPSQTFRNSIVQNGRLSLYGPDGSDGSCNVFWNVDITNQGFDLTSSQVADPLLCSVEERNFNVESGSPCRPEHSHECGWIGALEGECAPTPVLVSAMDARQIPSGGVAVSWTWEGVEPATSWSLWRATPGETALVR